MQKNKLRIQIEGYSWITSPTSQRIIKYKISIATENEEWQVQRRFNEFLDLKNVLESSFLDSKFPFPSKSIFKIRKESSIEQRRVKLEQFLVAVSQQLSIMVFQPVLTFLEFPNFLNKIFVKLTKEIAHPTFGLRGFHIYEGQGDKEIVFLGSDPSIMNRIDTYISKMNRSIFGNKSSPISALEIWSEKADPKNQGQIICKRDWRSQHTRQLICLEVFMYGGGQYIATGFDTGELAIFKKLRSAQGEEIEYEQIYFQKLHMTRVLDISFDSSKNVLYSVGRDSKICIFDLIKMTTITGKTLPNCQKSSSSIKEY